MPGKNIESDKDNNSFVPLLNPPNLALLMCLVQDLLSSGQHVLQADVVDHATGLIVAQRSHKDDLEHELRGCA